MTDQPFDELIDRAAAQFEAVARQAEWATADASELLTEALQDWRSTLEELRVANEELLAQHEELAQSREQAEAERRRYRALFELAPDGYLVTNVDGMIREANQAASDLLHVRSRVLMYKPLILYVAEREHRAFAGHIARLREGQPVTTDLQLRPRASPPFPAALTATAVRDGKGQVVEFRWLLRDVTDRKTMEATLEERAVELRELAGRLLTVQEDERRRLALELHDDLSQRLAAVDVEIEAVRRQLPPSLAWLSRSLEKIQKLVGELTADVGRLAHELHPAMVEDLGLRAALETHGSEFAQREGIQVVTRHRNVRDSIPPGLAVGLYRVAQEALRNVAKHAHASRATVVLAATRHGLGLCVRDDGVGFDRREVRHQRRGLGLASMEERMRWLGGRFSMRSRPGAGVHLHAWLPWCGTTA